MYVRSFFSSHSAMPGIFSIPFTSCPHHYSISWLEHFIACVASANYKASGQITGILKQMTDTMNKDLAEATAAENTSIKAFNDLMAAKEKEVSYLCVFEWP